MTPCFATSGDTAASFGEKAKSTHCGRTRKLDTPKPSLVMSRSRTCLRSETAAGSPFLIRRGKSHRVSKRRFGELSIPTAWLRLDPTVG